MAIDTQSQVAPRGTAVFAQWLMIFLLATKFKLDTGDRRSDKHKAVFFFLTAQMCKINSQMFSTGNKYYS